MLVGSSEHYDEERPNLGKHATGDYWYYDPTEQDLVCEHRYEVHVPAVGNSMVVVPQSDGEEVVFSLLSERQKARTAWLEGVAPPWRQEFPLRHDGDE